MKTISILLIGILLLAVLTSCAYNAADPVLEDNRVDINETHQVVEDLSEITQDLDELESMVSQG